MNQFSERGGRPGYGTPTAGRSNAPPRFDPRKSDIELFDTLAEVQADDLEEINSSQLRRFFGEVKEISRQFEARVAGQLTTEAEAIYQSDFAPRFKMLRSKVAYATRAGGQSKVTESFKAFLDSGVKQVASVADFRRFVRHFEAVVGFLYGKGKVKK